MTDVFRAGKNITVAPAAIPVPVLIAGSAIIATRCLSVLLLMNELGYEGIAGFVHRSAQAWDATLIFIASQLVFFVELRCAIMLMRGSNRGRWGYVITQLLVMLYMLMASIHSFYPEIFSIAGNSNVEILHSLLTQKFPDLLILLLLFVPPGSRKFFRKA